MSTQLKILRHSAAQLLALAVHSLFPKCQLVSGEATSLGFHYDFFFPEPITSEQIPFIEERMRDYMRQDLPFKETEMMRKNAIELFKYHHQDLKVALLKANVETLVHICQIGHFYDLGYPPFVESTKQIGVIKLLSITPFVVSLPGRPNLSLSRIQGIVFPDNNSLKKFLKMAEEAKLRDHRLLGKQMQLFYTFEDTCPGCWTWAPKGAVIRELLLDWWRREHHQQKFHTVSTPGFIKAPTTRYLNQPLLRFEADGPSYLACDTKAPLHGLIFKSKLRSYRELPLRYCEFNQFYDQGKESHLWGMLRARTFTSDSAYLFCSPEQVLPELISSLQFINKTISILGFEAQWHLIYKNQEMKGSSKKWDEARECFVQAFKTCGWAYSSDQAEDEIAPYGPLAEVRFVDALGREWKGPYVYIDLYHPQKLGLHYQAKDDQMHVPQMIGRSMFGSIERLTALLVEHYAGNLPLWLIPEQVRVLQMGEKNGAYAAQVLSEIEKAGFRAGIDDCKANLGVKVHEAENEKIPYMVIIGDKEEKNNTICVRKYLQKDGKDDISLEKFLEQLSFEIRETSNRLRS